MGAWLILVVTVIYAYIAGEQVYKGNVSMGIIYSGYAFSNIGLFLMAAK
jgi:hypothetical protein